MKVYALVGKAGTGKSYRAVSLVFEMKIDGIIDDGLFIQGNRKMEGSSAKKEATKISAVKRALFFDEEHRQQVMTSIQRERPESVLIIGTSDKMVHRIASVLELPEIEKVFYIHDVSTPEEIEIAQEQRMLYGKHVIPLPTVEIKRDFSGYFLDAVKAIARRFDKEVEIGEKTVMRPTFSYMGKYTIANKTLQDIAIAASQNISGFGRLNKMKSRKQEDGIEVELELSLLLGAPIHLVAAEIQSAVKSTLEHMTGLHIVAVNIHVRNLIQKSDQMVYKEES